jgi:hypothetical protein
MYTVEQRDRVHELTDVPFPAAEAPNPLVLADENTLMVAYISAAAGTSLIVFKQCYAIHFGQPNDGAFASHLLANRGLSPYGAFEVENSSWVTGLATRNRSHPRHDPEVFQRLRHWVWTFHDSVLECAAVSYAAVEGQRQPSELLDRMHALLRSD